jgi:hypothetical protein
MPTPQRTPARRARTAIAASVLLSACFASLGCSAGAGSGKSSAAGAAAAPAEVAIESGFLPNYKRLRPSDQFPSVLMYRDDADLEKGFRSILFRPVQVWRSADRLLDDIPQADLHYLADAFYRAMVHRLSKDFQLVDKPGPGVLEISLALTLVLKPKDKIDFVSADVPVPKEVKRSVAMGQPTLDFVHDCALEIEFAETQAAATNAAAGKPAKAKRVVRAAFFDNRRGSHSPKGNVRNWDDLDAVFAKWSEGLNDQLVSLKDGTFKPKLTTGGAAGSPMPSR